MGRKKEIENAVLEALKCNSRFGSIFDHVSLFVIYDATKKEVRNALNRLMRSRKVNSEKYVYFSDGEKKFSRVNRYFPCDKQGKETWR